MTSDHWWMNINEAARKGGVPLAKLQRQIESHRIPSKVLPSGTVIVDAMAIAGCMKFHPSTLRILDTMFKGMID